MGKYTDLTLKRLFIACNNACAFQSYDLCDIVVIDNEKALCQICHIEGEHPGSARYNPNMLISEKNDYANLIILCPTHHRLIDNNEEQYPVNRLLELKQKHENKIKSNHFNSIDMDLVRISFNSNQYSLFRLRSFIEIIEGLQPETQLIAFPYLREIIQGVNLEDCSMKDLENIIEGLRSLDLEFSKYLDLFTLLIQKVDDIHKESLRINYIDQMLDKIIGEDINNIYLSDLCNFCRTHKDILHLILTNLDRLELTKYNSLVLKIDFTGFTDSELNKLCSDIWKELEGNHDRETDRYKILIDLAGKCHAVNS